MEDSLISNGKANQRVVFLACLTTLTTGRNKTHGKTELGQRERPGPATQMAILTFDTLSLMIWSFFWLVSQSCC